MVCMHCQSSKEFLPIAFAACWIRHSSAGEILEYLLEFQDIFMCLVN